MNSKTLIQITLATLILIIIALIYRHYFFQKRVEILDKKRDNSRRK